MSHLFQLSDEQYAKLTAYAAQHKQTPETLFQAWLSEITRNIEESALLSYTEQVEQEEDILNSPLFQIAGMFAIGEPGWADKSQMSDGIYMTVEQYLTLDEATDAKYEYDNGYVFMLRP